MMEKLKSIKNIVKENRSSIIFMLIVTLLNVAMLAFVMQNCGIKILSKLGILILAVFTLITVLIGVVLYFAKKRAWKIEKIFLVCGLMLGTIYCFVLPIGGAPDEVTHFLRAYEYSDFRGYSGSGGAYVPENIREVIVENYGAKGNYQALENISAKASSEYADAYSSAEAYAFFNYIPQVVGIWIGKILQLPLIPIMWLARFLNMACCIIALYFCIKYIPIMKKLIFLIGLFPITMQQIASVSADGSIICAAIALVTYVLYARKVMTRKLKIWDFLLLLAFCLILVISKPVYALLCPIVFWIPTERFKSLRQKLIFIFVLGGITLGVLILKTALAPAPTSPYSTEAQQISYIVHHPIHYLWLVLTNAVPFAEKYIASTISSPLMWDTIKVYSPQIIGIYTLFAFLCAEREDKIKRSLRIFAIYAFVALVVAIFSSMFVLWSAPDTGLIRGVQGRYFLPILLLIPLMLLPTSRKPRKKEIVKPAYLYTFTTTVCLYAIFVVLCNCL